MSAERAHVAVVRFPGSLDHDSAVRAAVQAGATVLLAASVFHFHMIDIPELKAYLKGRGLNVRV